MKTNNMNKLTEVEQRYLTMLFDVEHRCKNSVQFTINDIVSEHRTSKAISVVLQEKGIIKNIGNKRKPFYVWKTIRPNINMARGILEVLREDQQKRNALRPKKPTNQDAKARMGAKINAAKQRNETVRVEPRMHPKLEQKTQKSIVIFWGLINIKF
jgi:hypothetical protein